MAVPTMGDSDEISPHLSGSHSENSFESAEAIEALCIVLSLIALTIVFEKFKHSAEHKAGRVLRPIVDALFGELTVLGFLSTVTYCLEKGGFFVSLSKMLAGENEEEEEHGGEEENEIFELVESIHFAMFFVMVIFLVQVLAEVSDGLKTQKEWCKWDRACQDGPYVEHLLQQSHKKDKEYAAISSMGGFRGVAKRTWRYVLPYLSFLPFLRNKEKETLEDKMEFCSLRKEFFRERSVDPPFAPAGGTEEGHAKLIGENCNFGRYLTFAYAKKFQHVIEIDVVTWLLFAGGAVFYFVILWALGFSRQVMAWVWVMVGWAFYIFSINFEKYLIGIRDRFLDREFIPQQRFRQFSWRVNDWDNDSVEGTEIEPLKPGKNGRSYQHAEPGEELPMWCHIDLDELDKSRSRLSKKIFGPTPLNRQHALYIAGSKGPEFHLFCLRVMLVFSCIYSAQLVILYIPMLARDEGTNTFGFYAYTILALIPALSFIFNKKRLIASLIQVGCIGSFILPQSIADSEREEKTAMAVRILVISFKLARMAKTYLADPSSFKLVPADDHYVKVFSSEEIAELGRIFTSFFDQTGDGLLTEDEFQTHMTRMGITMSDQEAGGLLKAILKSVEGYVGHGGEVALTPNAFFQWYASQLGDYDDKKECAKFLFSLFDDDDSGDITVLEFKQQLDGMDFGISHEETQELIQELDEDGNGVLCEDEFQDMIEHFYPPEFEHHTESRGH